MVADERVLLLFSLFYIVVVDDGLDPFRIIVTLAHPKRSTLRVVTKMHKTTTCRRHGWCHHTGQKGCRHSLVSMLVGQKHHSTIHCCTLGNMAGVTAAGTTTTRKGGVVVRRGRNTGRRRQSRHLRGHGVCSSCGLISGYCRQHMLVVVRVGNFVDALCVLVGSICWRGLFEHERSEAYWSASKTNVKWLQHHFSAKLAAGSRRWETWWVCQKYWRSVGSGC